MSTQTEAAARVRSDADYAFLSTASGRTPQEAGSSVDSDGSGCSCSSGRGLRLFEYSPKQEAGSSVDLDGSCCSCPIGSGLLVRLFEYRPQQEAGSSVDADDRTQTTPSSVQPHAGGGQ